VDTVVDALHLDGFMVRTNDKAQNDLENYPPTQDIFNRHYLYAADFKAYSETVNRLILSHNIDAAAKILSKSLKSPLLANSNFTVSDLPAFILSYKANDDQRKVIFDAMKDNERRICSLIEGVAESEQVLDSETSKLDKILKTASAKFNTHISISRKKSGILGMNRDIGFYWAENGLLTLGKMAVLLSDQSIQNREVLKEAHQLFGQLSLADLDTLYMRSVSTVSTSLADKGVTNIGVFLEYCKDHGIEPHWKDSTQEESWGFEIRSIASQFTDMHVSMIKDELESETPDPTWWINQMSNALRSVVFRKIEIEEVYKIVEDTVGKDLLHKLPLYKRHAFSNDMGL